MAFWALWIDLLKTLLHLLSQQLNEVEIIIPVLLIKNPRVKNFKYSDSNHMAVSDRA